jgi:Ulp1 family protease
LKTYVQQKMLEDATRLARAQLFAEYHQKVSKDEERARTAEERVRALEKEAAALREENRSLKQGGGAATSSKSLLQPTDAAEKALLKNKLSSYDSDVILDTMICGSSAKIFVLNLVCVRAGEWLNSETINVYALMVEAAAKHAGHNVTSFNSYLVSKLESDVSWEVWGVGCGV